MSAVRTAIIIGGGIAGPATAIALHKAGINASVHEAHPRTADGVGAFLTLASNGLDALGVFGADRAAMAVGFATPAITLRNAAGKRLGVTRTGSLLPDRPASHTMTRADLYRVLREEALTRGIRIEHGKRLVDAADDGSQVRAMFADGSQVSADILIGCDGVHSRVRTLIDPAAPEPRYSGLVTTGGYAQGVVLPSAPGEYEMIIGRRAFFGCAAAPDDRVWWFANYGQPQPIPEHLRSTTPSLRAHLRRLFVDDAGPATALIDASDELMPPTPIHTLAHLPHWHRGRMIVVGDAAHAPSPTSGQGASLSIEDAVELAKCLRDTPSHTDAYGRFETSRRRRVETIIKTAERMNSNKVPGPVGRAVMSIVLPPLIRMANGSKALRTTFDHHINWHTESRHVAKAVVSPPADPPLTRSHQEDSHE